MGAASHFLVRMDVAIKMGFPVYGIVAGAGSHMDGQSRNVPAPGKGVLGAARRVKGFKVPSVEERTLSLERCLRKLCNESSDVKNLIRKYYGSGTCVRETGGSDIEACLAQFGLTVNDLDVVSFHGTGTQANDTNEAAIVERMMAETGRSIGRRILGVAQKATTGHPKGTAAGWMLNGALQMMRDQMVPGMSTLYSLDPSLECHHIHFPRKYVKTDVSAVLINSFGFGQANGWMVAANPDAAWRSVSLDVKQKYLEQRDARLLRSEQQFRYHLAYQTPLVRLLDRPHISADRLESTLLFRKPRNNVDTEVICANVRRLALRSKVSLKGLAVTVASNSDVAKCVFTERERREAEECKHKERFLRGRAAAKFAVKQAMSGPCEVEIVTRDNGSVDVVLDNHMARQLQQEHLGISVSVSHDRDAGKSVSIALVAPLVEVSGVGVDVANEKVVGHLIQQKHFRSFNFSDAERDEAEQQHDSAGYFTDGWAIKEACVKALGNVSPTQELDPTRSLSPVECVDHDGVVMLKLRADAKQIADEQGVECVACVTRSAGRSFAVSLATPK